MRSYRSPHRRRTALLAAFAVAAALCPADAGAANPLPPAVAKIVERFTADQAGVLGFRQVLVADQHAPGHDQHDEQDVSYLQEDRKPVAARIHRIVDNGRTLNADEIAKEQERLDKRFASEPPRLATRFSLPLYPESAAEYTYSAPKLCAGCGDSIDFTSTLNDERHGHGTMTYDPATSRVTKLEFVPNVLPKPANAGKAVYTFGRHEDGGWGTARVEEHYSGRVLLISGTFDRITTIEHAKHFASVDEGRRALKSAAL